MGVLPDTDTAAVGLVPCIWSTFGGRQVHIQGTCTPSVRAHAGRTQPLATDRLCRQLKGKPLGSPDEANGRK